MMTWIIVLCLCEIKELMIVDRNVKLGNLHVARRQWCRVSPSSDQKRKGQAIDCSRPGLVELREIVF